MSPHTPTREEIRRKVEQRILRKRTIRAWIGVVVLTVLISTPFVLKYFDNNDLEPAGQVEHPIASLDTWEFYEDRAGQWRWRRRAATGKIVGASSRGYKDRAQAVANAERHTYQEP